MLPAPALAPAPADAPRFHRALASAILLVVLLPGTAAALAIDLSLNLLYSNPMNSQSGGTWELVAKSDGFGLASLTALLTNISTALNTGPKGIVNGDDPAGMAVFSNAVLPNHNMITIGQAPIAPQRLGPGDEQSIFYGVGTLANGTPGTVGPSMTSLTDVSGVPWATGDTFGDAAWATGVKLATGTFVPGVTPAFFASGANVSRGNTFTSVGTPTTVGAISQTDIIATTIVRTNLVGLNGDYNHNGVVDAADYVVWRKTLGSTTMLDADGNNNGMIDPGDYDVWTANFGSTLGAGSGTGAALGAAVPEPGSWLLAAAAGWFVLQRPRRSKR